MAGLNGVISDRTVRILEAMSGCGQTQAGTRGQNAIEG